MVGIAGAIFTGAFQVDRIITQLLDGLSHRGKNSELHTFKNTQVGICGGSLSLYKDSLIGLDGHLYDTEALRTQLYLYPLTATTSDTDLIGYAYDLWGPSFLEHLDGDFALFIFDEKKERLILARDRIGKRPLYWYRGPRQLIFASELKAILATGAVPKTPATDALATYLYFGFTPQDMTPIQGVNKLLPGYYLQYNQDKSKTIAPFWSYSSHFKKKITDPPSTLVEHVDKMLEKTVANCIPLQRPVGCLLSGGLGSSSVAYYLRRLIPPEEINSFSVGFQDESSAELQAAKEVSLELDLPYQKMVIKPNELLDDLVKIVWFLDEPLADPNVIATWHLAKLVAPTHVAFSGMGSDELFAGHNRYTTEERYLSFSSKLTQLAMPFIKHIAIPILSLFSSQRVYTLLQTMRSSPWQIDYFNQNALFNEKALQAAAPKLSKLFDAQIFLKKFHNLPKDESPVSSFLYLDVKTRLVDTYILQYERLTTAHNVDWRTPYLSHQLFEYFASIAEPEKLFFLKKILQGTLPTSVLDRPKKTRKDFLKNWIEPSGLGELFPMLCNGSLVELGLISQRWLKEHTATAEKRREAFPQLWGILILEIWYRLFINKPTFDKPPEISVKELLAEK
ncbi:MAG: asparagine synthetase B [Parachlamydiaceae bacterium]|nr:asparagine synthetase B [Parachlamydiaceae bacterium]